MHLAPVRSRIRRPRAGGFGMIQAVVLLLLVASALGAGLVLLQSRRAPEQTRTQEDSLRWAQQAVTAFASANSRLPCPARTLDGEEDCDISTDSGWLPLRTLVGASGTAPGVGPVRYVVYRGTPGDHLDLTQPLNAYQPKDLAGDARIYKKPLKDDDGNVLTDSSGETKTEDLTYDSVNGLDFCQALALASTSAATVSTTEASTRDRNGLALNVAYGLAAAGPMPGTGTRMDDGNASGSTLQSPWKAGDSGYDDRVRVQTFAEVAHAVGCRQIADGAINVTPYNIATASVDALAAALTLHDSVAVLQDNNDGNAKAAVRDASFAQAMAAAQILLAAGHIADTVSSNITDVADLIRAIGTCIASLGTTCWEVPIKASAIAMEIGSIISYGAALGVNIGTVSMAAKALNATIAVAERASAAKAGGGDSAEDVAEAAEKVCIASEGGYVDEMRVVKRDANGNVIMIKNADGTQAFDSDGNPLYEYEIKQNVWQDGLLQQKNQAEEVYTELQSHASQIHTRRIAPFSDSQIRNQIDGSQARWSRHDYRYRMQVCVYSDGASMHNQNGTCVFRYDSDGKLIVGNHKNEYQFNWDLAVSDAIKKRTLAEEWADANRAASEADEVLKLARNNYDQWNDTLLPAMIAQKVSDCAKATSSATADERAKYAQVCTNDEAAILYTKECKKTERVKQADGSYLQQVTTDTDPDASCLPRLKDKVTSAQYTKDNADANRNSKKSAYDAQLAPYINYPSDWSYWTLAEDGTTALGNPKYSWQQNPSVLYNPISGEYRRKPYYYVDEHELLITNTDVSVFNCILGSVWENGTLCERYPYSRAYNDYRTAKIAADEAKTNYENLESQYEMMHARCEALKNYAADPAGSGTFTALVFGAEEILRKADELGSVGAQPSADDDTSGTTP